MRFCIVLILLASQSTLILSVRLGQPCSVDEQCDGRASICKEGRCKCHIGYLESSGGCVSAPDRVGQACSTTCRPPLICNSRSQKCECIGARLKNGRCVKDRGNGASCSSDADCTDPFTQCLRSRCLCAAYTVRRGSSCVPVNQCPDGSRGGRTCRLNFPILDGTGILENVWNSDQLGLDSCRSGEYCVAYDDTTVHGFCCKATCPFGITPKRTYNPVTSAGPGEGFSLETTVGHSYAVTAACRQPCLDPKPVFVSGQCTEIKSHLMDCETDEECEGGVTMECSGRRRKKCKCKSGYQASDSGPGANLVCTKSCPAGQISAGMECVPKVGAGGRCVHNWQCPKNSFCVYGKCLCGGDYRESGGRCVDNSSGGSSNTGLGSIGKGSSGGGGSGNFIDTITGLLQGFGIGKTGK